MICFRPPKQIVMEPPVEILFVRLKAHSLIVGSDDYGDDS